MVNIVPFGLFETYLLFDNRLKLIRNNTNIILFYGSIRPYKGLNILIDAVDILKNKSFLNFKVVVAGSGIIANKAKLVNDKTYIIINRYISNEEIVALNKQARIIVCPYISASQSGIVMTTFLFGKPIIASDVGAFKEAITDMYNGLLITPNSAEDLANSINKLLNDTNLYNNLCKNVLKFNESSKFGWRQIAESTFNAYFNQ